MMFEDVMKQIIASRGHTQKSLALEVGVKPPSLANVLRKNNPTINGLSKYLKVLGYDIALIPTGAKLTDDSYIITQK
ncbi:helix-turn-helix domain-containing protein [Collinsella sp. AGMB00827]|uniref:Helix-turn-helix domain-containing protein n=1 Tax=Collinsella ureilytica TaxID=2869515 RepID=A0ABS7MMN8_9ACTN|nr:helix-turn-helix transcriptional regulator [Collinsella urealyticum]MBY4798340.1 helix-turn-helix domain-containing protein [Collinsella urealyticum]